MAPEPEKRESGIVYNARRGHGGTNIVRGVALVGLRAALPPLAANCPSTSESAKACFLPDFKCCTAATYRDAVSEQIS